MNNTNPPPTDAQSAEFIGLMTEISQAPNGALMIDVVKLICQHSDLLEPVNAFLFHPVAIAQKDISLELLRDRLREGRVPQIEELAVGVVSRQEGAA